MLRGARILVADDDPDMLEAVSSALEGLGAFVLCAANGGELIDRMADDGPFALIVADVAMPWMSGLQAMHSARTAGLGTPVIVMTALTDESIPAQVRALGEHTVLLRKPFELEELETMADRLLRGLQAQESRDGSEGRA